MVLPSAAPVGAPVPGLDFGNRAPYALPPLPYPEDALAPVISARTVGFHYGRHHGGYLTALNRMLAGDRLGERPLAEVILETAGDPARAAVFNNAAQVWNHSFYWLCLAPPAAAPGAPRRPAGRIAALIDRSFGSFEVFRQQFAAAALAQFGSGWAWLCEESGRLTIRRSANADTPIARIGINPLLTIDVWEHAYYLDYQNRRSDHVQEVIDRLLNWNFAEQILAAVPPRAMPAIPPAVSTPVVSEPSPLPPSGQGGGFLARIARRH